MASNDDGQLLCPNVDVLLLLLLAVAFPSVMFHPSNERGIVSGELSPANKFNKRFASLQMTALLDAQSGKQPRSCHLGSLSGLVSRSGSPRGPKVRE